MVMYQLIELWLNQPRGIELKWVGLKGCVKIDLEANVPMISEAS